MKTAIHQHLNGNRLVQLIRVGHSIWHIWVKVLQCQNHPIKLNKIVRHISLMLHTKTTIWRQDF